MTGPLVVLSFLVGSCFQPTTTSMEYGPTGLHQDDGEIKCQSTEDCERTLTSGVWKRFSRTETNEAQPPPSLRYTFTPDHRVTVVPSKYVDNVTTWSLERVGSDTLLKIGDATYLLYIKTQQGLTSMRLGQLSDVKATPSVFEDFSLEPRRHQQ
jgi:hypothetical protein